MDVPELLLWILVLIVAGLGGPFIAIFGGQKLAEAIGRWRARRGDGEPSSLRQPGRPPDPPTPG